MKTKEKDECSYSVSNVIRTLAMKSVVFLGFLEMQHFFVVSLNL